MDDDPPEAGWQSDDMIVTRKVAKHGLLRSLAPTTDVRCVTQMKLALLHAAQGRVAQKGNWSRKTLRATKDPGYGPPPLVRESTQADDRVGPDCWDRGKTGLSAFEGTLRAKQKKKNTPERRRLAAAMWAAASPGAAMALSGGIPESQEACPSTQGSRGVWLSPPQRPWMAGGAGGELARSVVSACDRYHG
ncbi:hypothetical protein BO94DRAFT_541748 [Aspergillus sclerotioniger CBS 115572]|uniref:Uncharacterized protein n=1 Tax=Aspergillus sclerotioniger CBS 115572 TaxID=1450535 RepID=A0A317XAK6_9EURO|nr:hypothetical protein BO94DRAFT_541748 [Aspergillus sclerotioniger CBS 115572]PWY95626.1 hypothetical protein BO94DRAFT_541748 [Aspergillus sclerotioniger CBS 115572]